MYFVHLLTLAFKHIYEINLNDICNVFNQKAHKTIHISYLMIIKSVLQ